MANGGGNANNWVQLRVFNNSELKGAPNLAKKRT